MSRLSLTGYLGIALVLIALGLAAGYYFYHPTPVEETYAPEAKQPDGSTILERVPDAKARPKQVIPKGGTVERTVEVVVKSNGKAPESALKSDSTLKDGKGIDCPPITVDATLVRLEDGSKRVVVSSPNGTILSGVDIPIESATLPRNLNWAAGISVNPAERTFGGWIDRDLGPFRVGAELNQVKSGFDMRIKAGMRF